MFKRFVVRLLIVFQIYSSLFQAVAYGIGLDDYFKDCNEIYLHSFCCSDGVIGLALGDDKTPHNLKWLNIPTYQTLKGLSKKIESLEAEGYSSGDESSTDDENSFECEGITRTPLAACFSLQGLDFSISNNGAMKISGSQVDQDSSISKPIFLNCDQPIVLENVEADTLRVRSSRIINYGESMISNLMLDGLNNKFEQNFFINDGILTSNDLFLNNLNVDNHNTVLTERFCINGKVEYTGSIETNEAILEENASLKLEKASIKSLFLNKDSSLEVEDELNVDVLQSFGGSIKNASSITIDEVKDKSSFKEIHNSHFIAITKGQNFSVKTLTNSGAFGINKGSLSVDSFKNSGAFKAQTLEVIDDLVVQGNVCVDNLTSKASVEVKEAATLTSKVQTQIKKALTIDEEGKADLNNLKTGDLRSDLKPDDFINITNNGSLNLNDQKKAAFTLNNHGKAQINGKNSLTNKDGAISMLLKNYESGHLTINRGTFDISSSNGSNCTSLNSGTFVDDSQKTIFLIGFENKGRWTSPSSRRLIEYSGQDMGDHQINGNLTVESLVDGVAALGGLSKTKASKIILNSESVNNQPNRFNRNVTQKNVTKTLISPLEMRIKGDFNNSVNIHSPSLEIGCRNLRTTCDLFSTSGPLKITASNYAEINSRIGGNDFVEINANNLKILGKEVIPNSNFHPMSLTSGLWSHSFYAPKSDFYKRNGNGIYSNGLIKLISNVIESNYGTIQGANFEIKATRLTNLAGLIAGIRANLTSTIDADRIINTRDVEGFGCVGHFGSSISGGWSSLNINYSFNHCPFPYACKTLKCETSGEGVIVAQGDLSLIYSYLQMLASRISCGGDLNLIGGNKQLVFKNMRSLPGRTDMQARNQQNCHIISRGNINSDFGLGDIASSFTSENIYIQAAKLTLQNLGITESRIARLVNLSNSMQKELPFDNQVDAPDTIVTLGKNNNSANLIYKNSLKVLQQTMGSTYFTLYRGIQGLGLNPDALFKMMFEETASYVRKHKDTTSKRCLIEYDGHECPVEVLNNTTLTPKDMLNSGVLGVFFEFARNINDLENASIENTIMVLPFEKSNSINAKGEIDICSKKDLTIKTSVSGQNVKLTSNEGSVNIESTTKRYYTRDGYFDTLLRTKISAQEDAIITAGNNVIVKAASIEAVKKGEIEAKNMVLFEAVPLVSYRKVTTEDEESTTTTKTTDIKQAVSTIKAGEQFSINASTGVLQQGSKNTNVRITAPVIIQDVAKDQHLVESHTVRQRRGGVFGAVSSCFGGNSKKEIHHNNSSSTSNGCFNSGDTFVANALKRFKAIGASFRSQRTSISAGEKIEIKVSNNTSKTQMQARSSGIVWNKSNSKVETHLINSNPHFQNLTYMYAPNVILEKVRGSKDTFKNIKSSTPITIKEVTDKHDVKEQSQKSLTPGASLITKLAVGITMMYSAPIAGALSLSGTTAVMANAGFASLCSDSATSLIENNGDPGKAIKALSTKQTVKNVAKSMLSAGVIHEITNVVGVNTPKELSDYAQKAVIKSAVDTVLSISIDGQSLESALKQGVTSAVISTGSSYLAAQIGANKAELGELNHKLLHGLLGGVSGGLTSTFLGKSFEDGAVSGALGAVVAETIAEITAPDLTQEAFTDLFMEKAQRSAKWGEFSGALSAFLIGKDAEIASLTAINAIENNFLQKFLLAQTAMSACQAYEIYQIYESEGLEKALDRIGIEHIPFLGIGASMKSKTFKSLKKAYDFALSKSPMLRKALERLEGKIEKNVESGVSKTKPDTQKIKIESEYKSELDPKSSINQQKLRESLAKEQQSKESGSILDSIDRRKNNFRDAEKFSKEYGGKTEEWVKKNSSSFNLDANTNMETHWVENIKTGQRVDIKLVKKSIKGDKNA